MACKNCGKKSPNRHEYKMTDKQWSPDIDINSLTNDEVDYLWSVIKPTTFQETVGAVLLWVPLIYGYVSMVLDIISIF